MITTGFIEVEADVLMLGRTDFIGCVGIADLTIGVGGSREEDCLSFGPTGLNEDTLIDKAVGLEITSTSLYPFPVPLLPDELERHAGALSERDGDAVLFMLGIG